MHYILDIAAAAVLIICIISGSKKGAARMIISAVGCAAAVFSAVFVSGAADEYIYNDYVRPAVISALEEKADSLAKDYFSADSLGGFFSENGIGINEDDLSAISADIEKYSGVLTNEEFSDKLDSVFIKYCQALTEAFSGIVPDEVITGAGSYINELETENARKLEMLTFDKRSAAELIEREFIRPAALRIVRTALFFVTFAAVSAVFALISYAVRAIRGVSAIRSADNALGIILGSFQGIVTIAALCTALYVFIKLTSDSNSYLNSDTISGTIAFKWMYSGTLFLLSLILK